MKKFALPIVTALLTTVVVGVATIPVAAQIKSGLVLRWRTLYNDAPRQWKADGRYPHFEGFTPVELAANRGFAREAQVEFNRFVKEARQDFKAKHKPAGPYSFELTTTMSLMSRYLVSGYEAVDVYTGGAHPTTTYKPITYGLVAGRAKRLTLADVLRKPISPNAFIQDSVLPALNKERRARGNTSRLSKLTTAQANSFVLTPTAMTWVFSPYEVGSYAEGTYMVKIPLSSIKGSLNVNGPLKSLGLVPPRLIAGPKPVKVASSE